MRTPRRIRRIPGVLAMLLGLMSLSGCWDQRAIENRTIVMALGISAHHRWTFIFPNVTVSASSLASGGQSAQFYSITVQARSYQTAMHRVQLQAAHQVSTGDLQLVDLSTDLSRKQVWRIVDAMILTGGVPAQVWLSASPTAPATLLTHPSPQTVVPVYYLASYFACHACHAAEFGIRAWRWWDRAVTPGVSPILPILTKTQEGAEVRHMLVYPSHGKPVMMPRRVTQGFVYLTGKVKSGTQQVLVGGATYVVSQILDHTTSRVQLTPTAVDVRAVLHANGEMADMPPEHLITRATERAIERAADQRLVQLSREAIQWANQTHTDPFGYAKRAAWLDNSTAAAIPPQILANLPIKAVITARVKIEGEGLAR